MTPADLEALRGLRLRLAHVGAIARLLANARDHQAQMAAGGVAQLISDAEDVLIDILPAGAR